MNVTEASVRESTKIIAESKKLAKKLVFTELELGLEFLKRSARYAKQGKTGASKRNRQYVEEVYQAVVKFLPNTSLTREEKTEIDTALALLKDGLKIT